MTTPSDNPMRVAQVLAGAAMGGAENFYTRLVCALAERRELTQCAFTRPHPEREAQFAAAGVATGLFRFGSRLDLLQNSAYRRALRRWQPDIVTTYMGRATSLTPPGDYRLVARLGHYYKLKYYRHCDYWIGIAKGICDHMVRGGFPADRVVHIPNFIEEREATPLPRDSYDTPLDEPLLLAVGRLHVNKGFDVLLQAMTQIPTGTLWLAGEGPERDALERQAAELGIAERVRFLGWRSDINELMRTADLFVCPSRHEGLGSIVAEAWFNGVPLVATRSQGPAELINHGETGLLVEIDDAGALAGAIHQLLREPKLAASLAATGRTHYLNNYSRAIITQRYIDFYRSIL